MPGRRAEGPVAGRIKYLDGLDPAYLSTSGLQRLKFQQENSLIPYIEVTFSILHFTTKISPTTVFLALGP